MSKHFHQLTVKEIIKETLNTVSIVFNIPDAIKADFSYESGQYLTLRKTINGEDVRRSYSISSCPNVDEDIKVTSKMIPDGKMSTYLFKELGVGDELEVMSPDGNFTLKNIDTPLVLFAAGSGITPIISILKGALMNGTQTVHLYYGNRSEEEIIFKEEFSRLRDQYANRLMVQHFLSSNGERLDVDRVKSIINGIGESKNQSYYFVCGPEGMIQAVKSGLESSAVNSNQIHIEYFASPKSEPKVEVESTNASAEVNDIVVVIDDEEHEISLIPGEAILDGASRIGIDPPFSCQSGVCTTCKAKLLSGEVNMDNNFGLGEDEIEEGYVLTCIGTPKTAGVKVSWDEV